MALDLAFDLDSYWKSSITFELMTSEMKWNQKDIFDNIFGRNMYLQILMHRKRGNYKKVQKGSIN